MTPNATDLVQATSRTMPDPAGLPSPLKRELEALFAVWGAKLPRNVMRTRYYYGANVLKDLGISIPPPLRGVETVVGWPAKAVDALATRSRFSAFTSRNLNVADVLNGIADENGYRNQYRMQVVSELQHSVSAVTVTRGLGSEVVMRPHSAVSSAMTWDFGRRRVRAGVTIAALDDSGKPVAYNLYTDEAVVVFELLADGHWTYRVQPHAMGRPMIEPLVYHATLDRPFGVSRISRAVMSITDSAVRTALRSEVSSEFFTSPQKYLLGAPDELFMPPNDADEEYERVVYVDDDDDDDNVEIDGDPFAEDADEPSFSDEELRKIRRASARTKWEAVIGALFAVSRDEDGELPVFGQLPAVSMQPHIEYMRSLAARFSGETNVPISELGIVQDNPSSAEAIYAAKEALISEAESLNEANGEALANVARMAMAIAQNKPLASLTQEERAVGVHWMNPARPNKVSQADAMTKQAQIAPWLPSTRVYWEELGYTSAQIDDILAAYEQQRSQELLAGFLSTSQAKPAAPRSAEVTEA